MAGISSKAVGGVEHKKKYNGIEFENAFDINIYDAFFRELDPQTGRWWEIDPKVDSFYSWSAYNSNFNNPIKFADYLGDNPILRALARKGLEWAVKTAKGTFKPVSREQAVKILKEGKSVFSTGENTAKTAKKLMKEAADGKTIVRHDGHKLPNGKTGAPHFQKKSGDGSHVFYRAMTFAASSVGGINPIDPGAALLQTVGERTGLNNLGKNIIGDNTVGQFLDNWINPFN